MAVSNEILMLFQDSVNLVNSWGETSLADGKTLNQVLTIEDISLWKMIEVELAMYKVPKVITASGRPSLTIKILRPFLGYAKQEIVNFIKFNTSIEGCESWPKDPVVLFLGFSESFYSSILAPVADSFSKERTMEVVVLNEDSLCKHWSFEVKKDLLKLKHGFKAAKKELFFCSKLPAIIRNQERSLWPQMRDTFSWFFNQRIPQLLVHIAVAKHILENHHPALVVSPDIADPRTRIYHLLCRKFSIPTLDIQQGRVSLPDAVEYQFLQADHVAAFGQQSRKIMLAHGVLDKQITITGSPQHDRLSNTSLNEKEKIRRSFGLEAGERIILFAATYYMSGFPKVKALGTLMTEAIFAAANQAIGVCLVVKPHPVFPQQLKELKSHAGGRGNIVFTDPQDNIQELIKACDAFVTFGSTSTLDALIVNKLTITPSFPGWSASDQFVESEATLVPRTSREITQTFQTVANGSFKETLIRLEPARVRFLENWIFKADGQASKRVCNLIKKMI